MSLIGSFILGIVQGATEFLPVSSSGHLILARDWLGLNTATGLTYDAILQLATVLAVILYFRTDVLQLARDLLLSVSGRASEVPRERRNLLLALVAGTIPAVAVGILLEDVMETTFRSVTLVAVTLVLGGVLMVVAEQRLTAHGSPLTVPKGWWIGWFQTLALVPGVSRSGATISGGLLLGLTREAATRFSFLLSIPVIAGSGLKKLTDVLLAPAVPFDWTSIGIGFLTAFLVGLGAIHFLLRYLKRHTLYAFVWYRFALAALVVLVSGRG
ncbi:undecaprenyl-diphosphatase UppP [Candidatus Uhrbacteria bacterium]|nr:undecaprenyl-diphosphatase UppP [Candidatus Uhrbacteria bacterium]